MSKRSKNKKLPATQNTKNKVGRPLLFKSPQVLEAAINAYFDECDNTEIVVNHAFSKGVTAVKHKKPYTMAGLAVALDCDRKTLVEYNSREEYFPIIKRARAKIEEQNILMGIMGIHDSKLSTLNLTSNFGYTIKSELDVHKTNEIKLSDEDLERGIELLLTKLSTLKPKQIDQNIQDAEVISDSPG